MDAHAAMFAKEQAPFTCAASFFMTLQPILVSLSKNGRGGFDYSMPASTLLSEGLKLGISGTLLVSSCFQKPIKILHEESLTEFVSYMVPGVIYFLNNNMIFLILQAVDPTTFQLLSQLKTIFTGLLFRIFLNRRLSYVQWLALVTLACGTAVSQIPTVAPKGSRRAELASQALAGVGLSVLSSFLSACGGIYNEKVGAAPLPRRPCDARTARQDGTAGRLSRCAAPPAATQGAAFDVDPLAKRADVCVGSDL